MSQNTLMIGSQDAMLAIERKRLIGLCIHLTGNTDVAEDLAQEALLEAWKHIDELRDYERFSQWLSGIARNICLRWARKRRYDLSRLAAPYASQSDTLHELEEQLADDFDLEVELEQKELIELLDRALALLPPETRAVLIARYVEESSLAEVADRLGLNISATAMRLRRGKLALRRVLTTRMNQEMIEYLTIKSDEMEQTRLWCATCGQHKLLGRLLPDQAALLIDCPSCGHISQTLLANSRKADLFQGIKSYGPAVARLQTWITDYYRPNLTTRMIPCLHCDQPSPLHLAAPPNIPDWVAINGHYGLYHSCEQQHSWSWVALEALVLALPESRTFCRMHPRVRTLPAHEVEVDGRAAIVSSFESITDGARLDVISTRNTLELLQVHTGGRV